MLDIGDKLLEVLANALSTVTILSCLFLKVPQIASIREKKSADGIFVHSMILEITSFTITTLYNYTNQYNVMTYMEYPIILVQIYVMLYYVLLYKQLLKFPALVIITVYVVLAILFMFQIISKEVLQYLVPLCTPLSSFAKVTYMYGIISAGNADAVSLTTWIISALTNLARVFTVFMDSADSFLLVNFTISTLLSSGVLFTALVYQINSKTIAVAKLRNYMRRPSQKKTEKSD